MNQATISDICVFCGPTISKRKAESYLNAIYLPPAGMGDMFMAYHRYKPKMIALIDGLFLNEPAVWHKEIMWLLSHRVAVIGCSSMGALRAAELERYGMHGSGKIFSAYKQGHYPDYPNEVFEDDDEVAVIHAPAELEFTPVSEAMVNIRSTFAQCVQDGVVSAEVGGQLVRFAKQRFYQKRSFKSVLDHADSSDLLDADQFGALKSWIDENKINQKSDDAVAMLNRLAKSNPEEYQPVAAVQFEATDVWNSAVEELERFEIESNYAQEVAID
jgi:hypothetical protein